MRTSAGSLSANVVRTKLFVMLAGCLLMAGCLATSMSTSTSTSVSRHEYRVSAIDSTSLAPSYYWIKLVRDSDTLNVLSEMTGAPVSSSEHVKLTVGCDYAATLEPLGIVSSQSKDGLRFRGAFSLYVDSALVHDPTDRDRAARKMAGLSGLFIPKSDLLSCEQ